MSNEVDLLLVTAVGALRTATGQVRFGKILLDERLIVAIEQMLRLLATLASIEFHVNLTRSVLAIHYDREAMRKRFNPTTKGNRIHPGVRMWCVLERGMSWSTRGSLLSTGRAPTAPSISSIELEYSSSSDEPSEEYDERSLSESSESGPSLMSL